MEGDGGIVVGRGLVRRTMVLLLTTVCISPFRIVEIFNTTFRYNAIKITY